MRKESSVPSEVILCLPWVVAAGQGHPEHIHSGLLPIGDLAASAEGLSSLPMCVKLEQRRHLSLLKREDFAFCVVPGNSLLENNISS